MGGLCQGVLSGKQLSSPSPLVGPPRKGRLGWWVSLCVLFAHSFAETLTKPAISAVCLPSLSASLCSSQ